MLVPRAIAMNIGPQRSNIFWIVLFFIFGVIAGSYLFSGVQPRSFLSSATCGENCLNSNDLAGLLGSIGVQKFTSAIPSMVKETDKTIAIIHPFPESRVHYVVIPKKDIKNISDVSFEDEEYITDSLRVIGEIIREQNLSEYKVITNGPGYQRVAYLHFHIMSK